MASGYYLLDHPNPRGPHYYTSRRARLDVIVMHITAGLESPAHVDDASAEATARYAATVRDRRVSWHSGSDTDSWLRLLPASYTAFHCAGYNSRTYGHEISKRTTEWGRMPPVWVARTLRHAADAVRPVASAHGIPLRWLTREQVDRGMRGFAAHSDLDPGRRSDPGRDFPWARFLELVANGQTGEDIVASLEEVRQVIREELLFVLRSEGVSGVSAHTAAALRSEGVSGGVEHIARRLDELVVDEPEAGGKDCADA